MYAMGFPGSGEQDEVPAVVRSPQTAQPISPLSLAGMTRSYISPQSQTWIRGRLALHAGQALCRAPDLRTITIANSRDCS